MRSSKSRSRSKSNRNRSVGNIVNRVFDSSGPEGKVRGTPQQIIEKYLQLARDAQLGNDRVATENFLQHAEHYSRMLGEATREAEARREMHEHQNGRDRHRDRDDMNGQSYGDQDGDGDGDEAGNDGPIFVTEAGTGPQPDVSEPPRRAADPAPQRPAAADAPVAKPAVKPERAPVHAEGPASPEPEAPAVPPAKPAQSSALDVVDISDSDADAAPGETGLVETPEEAPAKPRRRRARKPKADAEVATKGGEVSDAGENGAGSALEPQEAAE